MILWGLRPTKIQILSIFLINRLKQSCIVLKLPHLLFHQFLLPHRDTKRQVGNAYCQKPYIFHIIQIFGELL